MQYLVDRRFVAQKRLLENEPETKRSQPTRNQPEHRTLDKKRRTDEPAGRADQPHGFDAVTPGVHGKPDGKSVQNDGRQGDHPANSGSNERKKPRILLDACQILLIVPNVKPLMQGFELLSDNGDAVRKSVTLIDIQRHRAREGIHAQNGHDILSKITPEPRCGFIPRDIVRCSHSGNRLHLFSERARLIVVDSFIKENLQFNARAHLLNHLIKAEGDRAEQAQQQQ